MKKLFHLMILTGVILATTFQVASAQSFVARERAAVSPFFQVVPGEAAGGGFYTFMAFSHPSLSDAAASIGVIVSAEGSSGNIVGNSSVNFTVAAGETHKLFIVATNHSTINATTNSGSFTARDHFITTTSGGAATGNVRVLSANTTPQTPSSGLFNNLNQLAMWGVVFSEGTNAGFAMEFIGDMHDSTIASGIATAGTSGVPSAGRGIN